MDLMLLRGAHATLSIHIRKISCILSVPFKAETSNSTEDDITALSSTQNNKHSVIVSKPSLDLVHLRKPYPGMTRGENMPVF